MDQAAKEALLQAKREADDAWDVAHQKESLYDAAHAEVATRLVPPPMHPQRPWCLSILAILALGMGASMIVGFTYLFIDAFGNDPVRRDYPFATGYCLGGAIVGVLISVMTVWTGEADNMPYAQEVAAKKQELRDLS